MPTAATILLKLVRIVLLLALVLAATAVALAWYFGLWNVIFPSRDHDSRPPLVSPNVNSPAMLVFSKTNSFRHTEGIRGGTRALREIALGQGWDFFTTENGAIFNTDQLRRFDTVVFLNATGDMLSATQELAFQAWLEAGGGWLGIHAAGDGSHAAWGWYMDNLIGADFTAHIMGPQFQRATVVRESPDHPVAAHLPNVWTHSEEWYSWSSSPRQRGFNIIAVLEEDSYSPVQKFLGRERDLSMGDHPVVWSNCVGRGRTIYSALGHSAEAFDQAEHRALLQDALSWTMGLAPGGC